MVLQVFQPFVGEGQTIHWVGNLSTIESVCMCGMETARPNTDQQPLALSAVERLTDSGLDSETVALLQRLGDETVTLLQQSANVAQQKFATWQAQLAPGPYRNRRGEFVSKLCSRRSSRPKSASQSV
jgi:hypothetical protein